ncbi:MAG: Por secretion system protein, partial [Muribaculaceae bacterium]|nr:Por secretion system protein [Muribaculaceae bacterium]
EQGLYCYNTNNTPENFGDDRYIYWSSFTDQDSKSFAPTYLHCITEDKRGKIWVGTSSGVIELASQSSMFDENMRINRIKVPRNDGTNYADYLLDGESALCIAIDSSDRKWIGTASAGVYLVSEDGSQILQHFTTENSYLPSNKIGAILCDPKSNSVFFGTEFGLVEYSGTSSPASPDYSDVVAYPNPVTPDYTGLITIKGLMENSLVKISDSAGNVFYTTRSEGGMATWNGCNAEGQRVKSGVYFVLSSQNANGSSSGVVTKILIVN